MLEAELSREELELFDSKVLATRWYPIDTYRKLLATLARADAKGNASTTTCSTAAGARPSG